MKLPDYDITKSKVDLLTKKPFLWISYEQRRFLMEMERSFYYGSDWYRKRIILNKNIKIL